MFPFKVWHRQSRAGWQNTLQHWSKQQNVCLPKTAPADNGRHRHEEKKSENQDDHTSFGDSITLSDDGKHNVCWRALIPSTRLRYRVLRQIHLLNATCHRTVLGKTASIQIALVRLLNQTGLEICKWYHYANWPHTISHTNDRFMASIRVCTLINTFLKWFKWLQFLLLNWRKNYIFQYYPLLSCQRHRY